MPGKGFSMRLRGWAWVIAAILLSGTPVPAPADDNPQVAELIKLGVADDAHGDTRGAIEQFEAADKASPNNAVITVWLSKEYSDLIAVTKPPAEAAKVAQTSLDYAKRAVELDPGSAKAHLALAVGYGRMTDFTDNKTKLIYSKIIKEEAEKSLAIDPTDDYAYHVLGRWNYGIASLNPVLKLMAKFIYGGLPDASMEDAASYFKKAAEIAPQRIIHHLELARTYTALGKTDLADKEWETILTLHPANAEDEAAQKEARETLKKHEDEAAAAKTPDKTSPTPDKSH
jgi:tetratricopeptide (TPR) repeat protein